MYVSQNEDRIEIRFDYDRLLVSFVKELLGRTYHQHDHHWSIPLAGATDSVKKLESRGFTIDPALKTALALDEKVAQEAVELSAKDDTPFETSLPLFPYQKVGASFLYKIGSGLLGDEMGLGKTVQALAVCEQAKAQRVLIFCPSAVKYQWAEEIKRFLDPTGMLLNTTVIDGKPEEREQQWRAVGINVSPSFVIANYELLLRDFASMNAHEWDVLIADEATKISNSMTKTGKLIKKLTAVRRLALTGTPVSNRANELWNIIDFVSPGALGNYWGFMQRYCLKNQWGGIFG